MVTGSNRTIALAAAAHARQAPSGSSSSTKSLHGHAIHVRACVAHSGGIRKSRTDDAASSICAKPVCKKPARPARVARGDTSPAVHIFLPRQPHAYVKNVLKKYAIAMSTVCHRDVHVTFHIISARLRKISSTDKFAQPAMSLRRINWLYCAVCPSFRGGGRRINTKTEVER